MVVVAVLAAAALRGVDRLVDGEDHVGDRDLLGRTGEIVAPAGTADAVDQPVAAQLAEQLLEIGKRDARARTRRRASPARASRSSPRRSSRSPRTCPWW
jgi:hypothetical protein